jgi:hypothetical protein
MVIVASEAKEQAYVALRIDDASNHEAIVGTYDIDKRIAQFLLCPAN